METRKKKALEELQRLNASIDGEIVYENGIQLLKVDKTIGAGEVRCICFDEGLVAMEYDISVNQDLTVLLNSERRDRIYFLYCFRGNCFHRFENREDLMKLEELQTAVVSNEENISSELLVRKDERLIFNVIRLDKEQYLEKFEQNKEGFDDETLTMIHNFDSNRGYVHLGRFNLEIGELIKLLENAKYANNLSTLMQFEGICHLILAKQIEQFNIEMQHGMQPNIGLSKAILKQIGEIGDFVKNYPEVQHSVENLCRRSSLSAAKLQEGFKFLYGMTVGEYVRDCRLIRSEHLIRTTDMNVSEVVYSIGFTSRSYFCKIFKAKYRCSPKAYKKMVYGTNLAIDTSLVSKLVR